MRRTALLLLALCVVVGACGGARPKIAATVDGVAIPSTDVDRLVTEATKKSDTHDIVANDRKEAQRTAVLFLIRLTYLEQVAKRLGIDTRSDAAEKAGAAAATPDELASEGVARVDVERGLRASRLSYAIAAAQFPDVAVGDVELQQYYDSNRTKYEAFSETDCEVAFLPTKQAAQQVVERAVGAAQFAQVARAAGADRVDDLGWVTSRASLPKEILSVLQTTAAGAVGGPVDGGQSGWIVVHVRARRDHPARSFQQVKGDISHELVAERQYDLFSKWFAREMVKARVTVASYYGRWDPKTQLVV